MSPADLELSFEAELRRTGSVREALAWHRRLIEEEPKPRLTLVPREEYQAPMEPFDIDLVIQRFARAANVEPEQITGRDRRKEPSEARWEVMWAARHIGKLSFPVIGKKVGGRSHSDAHRGVGIVEDRIEKDPGLADRLRAIAGAAHG